MHIVIQIDAEKKWRLTAEGAAAPSDLLDHAQTRSKLTSFFAEATLYRYLDQPAGSAGA